MQPARHGPHASNVHVFIMLRRDRKPCTLEACGPKMTNYKWKITNVFLSLVELPQGCRECRTSASRDRDAYAAAEHCHQRACVVSRQLAHAVEPNQRMPVRPNETMCLHTFFQYIQRFAEKIAARTDPQLHVIARCFDPVDIIDVQHCCASGRRDHYALVIR